MPGPNEEGPCRCFLFSSCEAKSWTYFAAHADEAHGSCAASRAPGHFVLVVVATLGVVYWRDGSCGLVGALQVRGKAPGFCFNLVESLAADLVTV